MADDDGVGLGRVAALARGVADAPVDRETHAAGRARLLGAAMHVAAVEHAPALRWTAARVVAALAVLVFVVGAVFALGSSWVRPISFEVHGNANASPSYVSARDDAPADVRFSDGSAVVARPGTRLRIEETKRNGARVLVERGAATASIHHRASTSWAFVAGPFEIRVTGTKLSIVWDPESERIEVTLHEGSVEIDTPIGPSHYVVRAGQSFRASVRDGIVKLDDAQKHDEVEPRAAASGELPAPEVVTPERAPVPPEPSSTTVVRKTPEPPAPEEPSSTTVIQKTPEPPAPEESWAKRVRRGAFAEVVAAAQARGVEDCLAKCTAADLRALADAARYTSAPELATRALLALRSRGKGSQDAATAAFLLGRTAESTGDLVTADRWYATYLSESPAGALAAEALAGRMLAASHAGATAHARELAREYLGRYPDGAAVRAARRLAGPD
ncbi:MAG TPA: FecR domain-containing protein [Polyangiaceae bacterium]|nr:FecR domain-containing protein [Polyangiaceae bacterium]